MEESHPTLIQSHYFQAIDSLKISRYRLAAALSLVPFVFIGISTIAAGIALAMRTSTNMATVIGSISTAVLSIVVFFLARATKKRCLLRSEQGEKIR
jgi:membrane protein implicated in regulation of membrane protease activity